MSTPPKGKTRLYTPENPFRILAIDGGGVRGLIPPTVLTHLEARLQVHSHNLFSRLGPRFDLIAGTSSGAITAALLRGDISRYMYAKEIQHFFTTQSPTIFPKSPFHFLRSWFGLRDQRYPSEPLRRLLLAFLGPGTLYTLQGSILIPAYDIQGRTPLLCGIRHDLPIVDAVLGSCAAPTYFEPVKTSPPGEEYTLVDGGLFANNPALVAYFVARTAFGVPTNSISVLSLGTGKDQKEYPYKRVRNWGAVQWIKPVLDMMMGGQSASVDWALTHLLRPSHYTRINPYLGEIDNPPSHALDDTSPRNLRALRELGEHAAAEYPRTLDIIAKDLAETEKLPSMEKST